MKRIIIGLMLLGFCLGLMAETGLLGIWHGEDYSSARKSLESSGYTHAKNKLNVHQFTTNKDDAIYKVVLYLDRNKNVAGWAVHFRNDLTEPQLAAIYEQCIQLHGNDYSVMQEENMVNWQLGEKRTFKLGFDDNDRLSVGLYKDDAFPELFIPID